MSVDIDGKLPDEHWDSFHRISTEFGWELVWYRRSVQHNTDLTPNFELVRMQMGEA